MYVGSVKNLGTSKRLIRSVVAAVALVLIISAVSLYVLPQHIYISPFSNFYASAVVYYKTIEVGADNQSTVYVVSFSLITGDPVNDFSGGPTLYQVSKADWDMVSAGDGVKIKLLPNAQAQIVEIGVIPTALNDSREWRTVPANLPLTLNVTSDKPQYAVGETANFTVRLTNDPALAEDATSNVSLVLFKDCIYYVFETATGKLVTSNDNQLQYNASETRNVSIQPSQEIDYTFNLDLSGISPGTYSVRAYIGYYPPLEGQSSTLHRSITLTAATRIDVTK